MEMISGHRTPSPSNGLEAHLTVSLRNTHTPEEEITAFLRRFCTVLTVPTKALNGFGFWTGSWSVTVRLWRDSSPTGFQHLPQRCRLGDSEAMITYPGMPQIESRVDLKEKDRLVSVCLRKLLDRVAEDCSNMATSEYPDLPELQPPQPMSDQDRLKRNRRTKRYRSSRGR